jgi:hypothetical protein
MDQGEHQGAGMMITLRKLGIWCFVVAVFLMSRSALAQTGDLPSFLEFEGQSGYQEIALAGDSWYLAFHGTRNNSLSSVEAGFWGRAAQLCRSAGKAYVVELVYVGERVLPSDPNLVQFESVSSRLVPVRSFIYIPIFIRGGPVTSNAPERVITPSKMSAIRCLSEDANTISGLRPIPV